MEEFYLNNTNKQEIKKEIDPDLLQLWEDYGFPGKPPFKGSKAEAKLKDICIRYRDIAENIESISNNHLVQVRQQDSENFFSHKKDVTETTFAKSDASRRELHNQIAMMVVSKQRSKMDNAEAQEIARFAMEYADILDRE